MKSAPRRVAWMVAACLAALSAATGCTTGIDALVGHQVTPPEAPPPTPTPRDLTASLLALDPGQIRVSDRGAEPHELLSLGVGVDTDQRLTVTQSGHQEFVLGAERSEIAFPDMTVTTRLVVAGADDTTVEVDAAVETATVAGAADRAEAGDLLDEQGQLLADDDQSGDGADRIDSDPVMVTEAAILLSGLDQVSMRMATDQLGRVRGAQPILGQDVDYEPLVFGYLERNFLSLVDPLPDVPVGVGATWSVTSLGLADSIPAEITRRYELVEITDEHFRAELTRTVRFVAGTYHETTIVDGSGLTGVGEVVWHRGSVLGVVDYELDGEIVYDLGGSGRLVQAIHRVVKSSMENLHLPATPTPTPTAEPVEEVTVVATPEPGVTLVPGPGETPDPETPDPETPELTPEPEVTPDPETPELTPEPEVTPEPQVTTESLTTEDEPPAGADH